MAKVAAKSVETVATVAVGSTQTAPPVAQPEQKLRTRILVVDDESFVRELLGEILDGEQCDFYLAESGSEALSAFKEMEFDGIFTDVGMPGMSGWEFAREIRQIDKNIPIAVITGWGEAVGSNEQKAAGVDWVIAKPFTADRISELVREVNELNDTRPKVAIVAA